MHADADTFLDAIYDSPDDDTPRLVYADWLQEHDQENYAQFIRLQCAAAREPFGSPEANRLWEEIGRVWTELDEEWWPATRDEWQFCGTVERWNQSTGFVRVPGLVCRRLDAIHFHRGFLTDRARVCAEQLLRSEACWPWFPPTRLALFPDLYGVGERLATLPLLRRVRHLWFADGFGHHLDKLFRSPHLDRLRALDLSRVPLGSIWVQALVETPYLDALQEVHLSPDDEHADCDPEDAVLKLMERFPRVIRQ